LELESKLRDCEGAHAAEVQRLREALKAASEQRAPPANTGEVDQLRREVQTLRSMIDAQQSSIHRLEDDAAATVRLPVVRALRC
jgi:hypothetical protein